ncbi:MAG: hypothetical protein SF028_07385 [Candidatus Sumerlaeia bacterium]|nr:hypothetical protein [Candidatus Sumerlaeia bacterium]
MPDQGKSGSWTHRSVYEALVARGEKQKDPTKKDRYVQLYPQDKNCAILYAPGTQYQRAPIHLNKSREGWREDVWHSIRPALTPSPAKVDNKGPGKESQNFSHYPVLDWGLLAKALGL